MTFTESSTIRDIVEKKPNGKLILDKYVGRRLTQQEIDQVYPMAVKALAPYVTMDQEKLMALIKELNA